MKYAILGVQNIYETREDNYPLKDGAIVLTDEQFDQLRSLQFILQDGQIVVNPNPPSHAGG
jgi:hypothetical protein